MFGKVICCKENNGKIITLIGVFLALLVLLLVLFESHPRTPTITKCQLTVFENEYVIVQKVGEIEQLAVAYIKDGSVYATEDHYVYEKSPQSDTFESLGHFHKSDPDMIDRIKDFVARLRISRHYRKAFGANNYVVLESQTLLTFYDHVYRSTYDDRTFHPVYSFSETGSYDPFNKGVAVDADDNVYFGEYYCKEHSHKIKILKGTEDGANFGVYYEFPAGQIFHIHSMKYDHYRNRVLICTGDEDDECNLMYIDEDTHSPGVLGGGDQGWRIVSLMITEDFLYWCSDNDRDGSHIYRYNVGTGERERLASVGKPSYYSTQLEDGTLVFSTTYEPSSRYSKQMNPDATTDIWISRSGTNWFKVLSITGDPDESPYGLTRPQIILPSGDASSRHLFLTPIHTLDGNFCLQEYTIEWKQQKPDRKVELDKPPSKPLE
ncbi:MAG: hypothetical protein KOO62_04870 [candidate division Zixibacteria bacterium]|nr:hypothetical protein [candidate division Zixibacteria bacterium]